MTRVLEDSKLYLPLDRLRREKTGCRHSGASGCKNPLGCWQMHGASPTFPQSLRQLGILRLVPVFDLFTICQKQPKELNAALRRLRHGLHFTFRQNTSEVGDLVNVDHNPSLIRHRLQKERHPLPVAHLSFKYRLQSPQRPVLDPHLLSRRKR